MEYVLKITNKKADISDYNYWKTISYTKRLETIELLRQQYINFNKNVQPRLQRVCTIINKA